MLYVQDRMNHTLAVLDNYYNDTHTLILESGVSTYNFTIPKNQDGSEYLVRGNYVVLADDKGQGWKFTIMATDETHSSLDVECEDLGLELLNKVRNSWASPGSAQPFKFYFDKVVRDTGWTLGVNEISNLSRTLSWDGRDTALKRLLSICTQFDHAEIEFKVEFKNMQVTKQVVNVYKQRGANRSDVQLVYGDTVNDIRKTTEIRELATAIQGVGGVIQKDNPVEGKPEEHVDFASLTYDDGEYFTPVGDPFLYARVANQQFNIKDTYLEDFYDYDTQDAQELLNRTLTQLKERCQPKVNYEVDLAKVDSSLNLGDTVTIIDHDYKPELLLSGRVLQLEKSYTDSSKNKATFGNFLILYSNISDQLRALQEQMNSLKPVANYTWIRYAKDDKGTGMTSTPTTDTQYIAIVSNKSTGVPSDNVADYAGHWQLIKGNDGKNGLPGAVGADGKTSYTHFAYANNVSGTDDFSLDDPTGRAYMGVFSDFTKADSTDPSKYSWVELVGNLAIGGRNYFSVSGFAANKYALAGIDFYDLQLLPNTKYTASTNNVGTLDQGYANVFVGNKGFTVRSDTNGLVATKPRTVMTDSTGILTIAARTYSIADGKDKIQVELGTVATTWQPAPEDTQGQIDTINNGLANVNSKIAAVTKVDSQATAPTNPKKGDQWWVKDANGDINAFKIWDGTKWADSIIQQSLLNIVTLNSVTLNSAAINSPDINVPFTDLALPGFPEKMTGVMTIKDAKYSIDGKYGTGGSVFHTGLTPDGWESYKTTTDGSTKLNYARVNFGELQLWTYLSGSGSDAKYAQGSLSGQDTVRNSIATPTYYTNGWAPWTTYWPFLLKRNGRQITISGYLKNTGSSSSDFSIGASILKLPDWGEPFTPAIIPGTRQNAVTVSTGDVSVVLGLDKSGILHIESSGFKVGQWLSFSASYFGKDLS